LFKVFKAKKEKCRICKKESEYISGFLSLCLDCIRREPSKALKIGENLHLKARDQIGLFSGEGSDGVGCDRCAVNCNITEGEKGYCGLLKNESGRLVREFGTSQKAVGVWYHNPHPTNCVPSWCCPGSTGSGHPRFAKTPEGDLGYRNAAVFLGSCSSHCLYCQNTDWHDMASSCEPLLKKDELVSKIVQDGSITCLCWFGGSPEPQAPFVYEVSKSILDEIEKDRIFRICLEINGNFNWGQLEKIAKLSLKSGGGIKFDLKAWDKNLYRVLTGVDSKEVYKNFKRLNKFNVKREQPPFLRASTLLLPGYIDLEEISNIAAFISEVDTSIPYSLLSYAPAYKLDDLPATKKDFALTAKNVAENQGLENVNIGNIHLLQ